MGSNSKPIVLFCASPADGHVMPLRAVAKNLVTRGFEVIFPTGSTFQSGIENIGATFTPLQGIANFSIA
jgi:UDP:flavonoid glycosyltransferase YjiC (YdhE family)